MKIDFIELLTIFHPFNIFPSTQSREKFSFLGVLCALREISIGNHRIDVIAVLLQARSVIAGDINQVGYRSVWLERNLINSLSDVTHAKSIKACHTRLHVDDSQTGVKHLRDKENH